MTRKCKPCDSPHVAWINEQLLLGAEFRYIADQLREQFGESMSTSTLHRHAHNHVPGFLTHEQRQREVNETDREQVQASNGVMSVRELEASLGLSEDTPFSEAAPVYFRELFRLMLAIITNKTRLIAEGHLIKFPSAEIRALQDLIKMAESISHDRSRSKRQLDFEPDSKRNLGEETALDLDLSAMLNSLMQES